LRLIKRKELRADSREKTERAEIGKRESNSSRNKGPRRDFLLRERVGEGHHSIEREGEGRVPLCLLQGEKKKGGGDRRRSFRIAPKPRKGTGRRGGSKKGKRKREKGTN